jgi:hypothetical protein
VVVVGVEALPEAVLKLEESVHTGLSFPMAGPAFAGTYYLVPAAEEGTGLGTAHVAVRGEATSA